MKNRILAVAVALIMIFAFTVNASATEQSALMPDLTQKGSLTLSMLADGVPLDSGRLNLYRVAELKNVVGDGYGFYLLDALGAVGATLDTDNLYDENQAQRLLEYAKKALSSYDSMPIADGRVRFSDLEAGLYLVWQRTEDASEGYYAISPFLISVPKWQDGTYTMQVDAMPKVPLVNRPPEEPPEEPPTPPPPPELPKTGQLNWPIPVMATIGTVLLIIGLILCAYRKRCGREK